MFWIRYTDNSGTHEVSLSPTPTSVDYPLGDGSVVKTTQDGAVVIQRPLRDGRPRKWMWTGFAKDDASYRSLWTLLQSLRASVRWNAGLTPTIDVWEDVTGAGGFDKTDAQGNKVYTTVKLNEVSRTPAANGPVFYNSSVTFYIQDASYGA